MSAEFRLSAHLPVSAIDGGHELGIRLVTSEGAHSPLWSELGVLKDWH